MIAANAGRYPVSAQCVLLGVARSAYYRVLADPPRGPAPDPLAADAVRLHVCLVK